MMEQFEATVFAQQPASKPWTPVTDYSFEARKAIEGEQPRLLMDVFRPKRIVDVGSGFGHLVRLLNEREGWTIAYGLDVCDDADYYFDVTTRAHPPKIGGDLVICREVLEHLTLRQVRRAITNLCALSSRYVYITTRFSSEHDLLRVETSDDLDPTHITLPAKDLYRLLLTLEGFKRRADLETAMDWQHKGRCLVYERV